MLTKKIAVIIAAAVVPALMGCSFPELGEHSSGQLGTLDFEYTSYPECIFGCAMDREVLTGTEVTVTVRKLDDGAAYEIRTNTPDIATMTSEQRCGDDGTHCSQDVTIVTKKVGDAILEVRNTLTNDVVDRATIKVRDATAIAATVRVANEPIAMTNGAFELRRASTATIELVASSSTGSALLARRRDFAFTYADKAIVGPDPSDVFGERITAVSAGATGLIVTTGSARADLSFRVVE